MRINVDLSKCTGCGICELSCSLKYEKAFNLSKARIRVEKNIPPKMFKVYVCHQCSDAPCISSCPTGALNKDSHLDIVKVDEDKCTGCLVCVEVCPYKAIWVDHVKMKVFKCELCGGSPFCVDLCPWNALTVER